MKLSYEDISKIKQSDLPKLMLGYGLKLSSRQNGSYSFFCPFHNDTNPSLKVNLKGNKWLWHCFGCNLGGNVVNFVMKYEGLSLPRTYEKLINLNGKHLNEPSAASSELSAKENLSAESQKLLNRVIEFYHSTFSEDKRALQYLTKERNIYDKSVFETFKLGFANGTLLNTIPQKGEVVEQLKELGILNKREKEHFLDCIIFPIFDDNDNVLEIYGRRIHDKEPKHLYLKGSHKGVFNHYAAKTNQTIILTEGIIDCLSIYQAGFKNVIPLYGTNSLTQCHIELFKKTNTNQIYLSLDNDEAGTRAAGVIKQRLAKLDIDTYIVELPQGMDPNEYFKKNEPSGFEELLNKANRANTQKSDTVLKEAEEHIQILKDSIIIQYNQRRYLIRGIDSSSHQKLRVNIKAFGDKRFHIDTIDLYIAKQRKGFAREAALLYREEESLIEEDLNRIIERVEEYIEGKRSDVSKIHIMPDKDRQEALKFLKSPNLMDIILTDFEIIGCAGETTNKLIGYLAAVSRKLDDPLSLIILSRSAAGKSLLQDSILELVPTEDKSKYTRITGQALFYKGEDSLKHKIIAIEEEEGANEASYSIRNIQSSKLLTIATTIKDPLTGSMKTIEYHVKGPLAIILTTTRADIDYETLNRFIVLTIDETREQTRLIHKIQREKDTLKGLLTGHDKEAALRKHHNAQRLLRPLKVINPYAHLLTFSDDRLRARRDHKKYLNLIKTIAFLFQYQREVKNVEHKGKIIEYIEVTLNDIALANSIAHEVLGRSLDELSPPSRKLLFLIKDMVTSLAKREGKSPPEARFTRRDIREHTKWSDYQVRIHLAQLVDLEYVIITSGRNGSRFIYELIYEGGGEDGSAFLIGLVDIEELRKEANLVRGKFSNGVNLEAKLGDLEGSLRPACGHLVGKA